MSQVPQFADNEKGEPPSIHRELRCLPPPQARGTPDPHPTPATDILPTSPLPV